MSSKKIIYLILIVIVILAVGYFVVPKVVNQQKQTNNNQVACTMEAKICPDGSSVGRIGPNCEFALCPEADKHADWQTCKDVQSGLEFKYPKELEAKYITPQEWPFKVSFVKGDFNCQAQDGSASLPSRIISTAISGKTYCVEAMSEGAAGSTYTTYVYSVKKNDGVLKADFIFRYPQCLNYDEPRKTACQTERADFNLDSLVDEILNTVVY